MSNSDKQRQECADGVPVVACATAFQRIEDKLDQIIDDNRRLKETVYGNGKRGHSQRLHDVEMIVGTAKWIVIIGFGLLATQFFELLINLFRGRA